MEIGGEFVWNFLFYDKLGLELEFELSTVYPQFGSDLLEETLIPKLCKLPILTEKYLGYASDKGF